MKSLLTTATILLLATLAIAQKQEDKSKRPSPPGTAQFTFADGKKITVEYSRPSMRSRTIYGELVPYGKVWRTGANEATSFVTEADLDVNGVRVSQGAYTLYTLPSEGTWKLIINKQTGQWGTVYDSGKDLARIDMEKTSLPQPVEQFTISFVPEQGDSTAMNFAWEKTRVSVPIKEAK